MKLASGSPAGAGAPPLDTVLYESPLVRIGAFRAAVDHPRFTDSGPIEEPIFVFPRTSVVIRHEGRLPFVTDTRTVTFYNCGQRYTRHAIDPRGDRCEWFGVREDVLRESLAPHDPSVLDRETELFPFPRGPSDERSYAYQRLVVRHLLEAEKRDALLVDEAVIGVLRRVAGLAYGRTGDGKTGEEDGRHSAITRRLRAYLLEHYTRRLTLDEIADAVGASVYYLCRIFKRELGTTIHRYREQLRMRRSLEMVADSRDLTAVALELGYSSHSHLTASFRRTFGVTPSQFRRRVSARRLREMEERLAPG